MKVEETEMTIILAGLIITIFTQMVFHFTEIPIVSTELIGVGPGLMVTGFRMLGRVRAVS